MSTKPASEKPDSKIFTKISKVVTKATGTPAASIIAAIAVVIWGVLGPVFKFSDTWQLVINTSTTIITFLMVFVIQQSQNRDSLAVQLKLNELIASSDKASNRLVDIEDLTEKELETLKKFYIKLASQVKQEEAIHDSHSLDEATANNHQKKLKRKNK